MCCYTGCGRCAAMAGLGGAGWFCCLCQGTGDGALLCFLARARGERVTSTSGCVGEARAHLQVRGLLVVGCRGLSPPLVCRMPPQLTTCPIWLLSGGCWLLVCASCNGTLSWLCVVHLVRLLRCVRVCCARVGRGLLPGRASPEVGRLIVLSLVLGAV